MFRRGGDRGSQVHTKHSRNYTEGRGRDRRVRQEHGSKKIREASRIKSIGHPTLICMIDTDGQVGQQEVL